MSRIVDVEPLDCLAWKDGEHGTTFDDGVLWVLEKIGELPSAQPERKLGKWINSYKRQTCSVCKQRGYRSWNFCPNCGADMRKDGD